MLTTLMPSSATRFLKSFVINDRHIRLIHASSFQLDSTSSPLSFRDHESVFRGHSSMSLLRGWLVFRLCSIGSFVANAESLLALGNRTLGKEITVSVVKETFFKQFCAGETQEEVWRTMQQLQSQGVSAILDYAAEDDVGIVGNKVPSRAVTPSACSSMATASSTSTDPSCTLTPHACPKEGVNAVARVYDYKSEQQCDR
ncbi:hypothetical protein CEUSTIGMA_g10668.t1 [Chlamydomonas eustigma]|uniref:Proline dehydrogenase n=1 Tax=Chlamydomonas eustigma TaxID=1157962 RepID=A0A250XJZ8_9CHLO|nr:hypothetical protein CEUSTIGMA_g10668.t1 [Chlamydomonas eustigma]|eukprot:GAX83242.1 hypothetical protein CEUSTIGMA_g10668.t1 [Chlamydomonas eustigma]